VNIFPCNHIMATVGNKVEALNYLAEIAGIRPIILGEDEKKREIPVWERIK